MALPKCPKCDSTMFAMTLIEPYNSNYKINAVHCNSCGAVLGTADYYDTAVLLKELAQKLNVQLNV